jgi:hypothetical protein
MTAASMAAAAARRRRDSRPPQAPALHAVSPHDDPAPWSAQQKLQSLKPVLAHKLRPVLVALMRRGFQPTIACGWRPAALQMTLRQRGETVLGFSLHNLLGHDGTPRAQAVEIIDARYGWSDEAHGFWDALGQEARRHGLHWGGDTGTALPRDRARVQMLPHRREEGTHQA